MLKVHTHTHAHTHTHTHTRARENAPYLELNVEHAHVVGVGVSVDGGACFKECWRKCNEKPLVRVQVDCVLIGFRALCTGNTRILVKVFEVGAGVNHVSQAAVRLGVILQHWSRRAKMHKRSTTKRQKKDGTMCETQAWVSVCVTSGSGKKQARSGSDIRGAGASGVHCTQASHAMHRPGRHEKWKGGSPVRRARRSSWYVRRQKGVSEVVSANRRVTQKGLPGGVERVAHGAGKRRRGARHHQAERVRGTCKVWAARAVLGLSSAKVKFKFVQACHGVGSSTRSSSQSGSHGAVGESCRLGGGCCTCALGGSSEGSNLQHGRDGQSLPVRKSKVARFTLSRGKGEATQGD